MLHTCCGLDSRRRVRRRVSARQHWLFPLVAKSGAPESGLHLGIHRLRSRSLQSSVRQRGARNRSQNARQARDLRSPNVGLLPPRPRSQTLPTRHAVLRSRKYFAMGALFLRRKLRRSFRPLPKCGIKGETLGGLHLWQVYRHAASGSGATSVDRKPKNAAKLGIELSGLHGHLVLLRQIEQ